jgi:magnesium chelatase family protein
MDIPCPVKDNHQHGSCRGRNSAYDLTLFGILVASEQIKAIDIDKYIIMGELSLDGSTAYTRSVTYRHKAKEEGFKGFFSSKQNVKEAAIVTGLDVYGVENVQEVILRRKGNLEPTTIDTRAEFYKDLDFPEFDFSDVKGQESIKGAWK